MLPTPSLSHLTREDLEKIYEPAEDTFIFLDALEADAALLRGEVVSPPGAQASASSPRLVVEIGSGSGCVSTFLAQSVLGPAAGAAYLCTDLNPHAAECTVRTGLANGGVRLDVVRTSMLAGLVSRLGGRGRGPRGTGGGAQRGEEQRPQERAGLVDLLLFNPPYVPTTAEEEEQAQRDAGIAGAWAGGWTGTRLLDELIDDVDQFAFSVQGQGHGSGSDAAAAAALGEEETTQGKLPKRGVETLLSPGGYFYFIAIKQNDTDGLVQRLIHRGLEAKIALSRRAGREHLFVIRARKPR